MMAKNKKVLYKLVSILIALMFAVSSVAFAISVLMGN